MSASLHTGNPDDGADGATDPVADSVPVSDADSDATPVSDVPVLSGETVVLRAWREDDRPHLEFDESVKARRHAPHGTDVAVARWLATQRRELADRSGLSWCIADARSDRPLGWMSLSGLNQAHRHGSAEVTFGMFPQLGGQGALAEALELVQGYAFGAAELDLHRLWAIADHRDTASQARLREAGFLWCGTERRALVYQPGGRQYDLVRFELLAEGNRALLQGRRARHVPIVQDGPIRLRPWHHSDAARVVQACSDPETQLWLPLPDPYTLGDAESYISKAQQADPDHRWAFCVADGDSDACLGALDVHMDRRGDAVPGGEVGYWMHPEARGRGLMSAAVRLLVTYAFTTAQDGGGALERLSLLAADPNTASRKVATNAGFREVGRDRSVVRLRDGRVVDHVRYDLLAGEAGR